MKRFAILTALMFFATTAEAKEIAMVDFNDGLFCGCGRVSSTTTVANPTQGEKARLKNVSLKKAFFTVQGLSSKARRSQVIKTFKASNPELLARVRATLDSANDSKKLTRVIENHNRKVRILQVSWTSFKESWKASKREGDLNKSMEANIFRKQADELSARTLGQLNRMAKSPKCAEAALAYLLDSTAMFGKTKIDILAPALAGKIS